MPKPLVRFRTPDSSVVEVPPGGIIGRLSGAALRLEDPLVSEAHALVSLRGRKLKLLALRGWLEVDGKRLPDVVLEPGQKIFLAQGVGLSVLDVELPNHVLAVTGLGSAPVELAASVYSLLVRQPPGLTELKVGYVANAAAHIFSTTDGFRIRPRNSPAESIVEGGRWTIEGVELGARAVSLAVAGAQSTIFSGRFHPPTRVVARYDTVHVLPEGQPPVIINGVPAHIVSELVSFGAPAPWEMVAREIWRDEDDRSVLRQNWDRNLRTLRAKLRANGVRDDLVRPDGKGNVELFLLPGDECVNET